MIFFRGKAGNNPRLRKTWARQTVQRLQTQSILGIFSQSQISFAIHIHFHPFSTHPSHLCEMPGTTPEKRPRNETQASEAEATIPKCELDMSKSATARSVLKFAKLSQNAYAPTKGKNHHILLMAENST